MLEQLKLNNLALAVQAEVDFTPGMICITGETGAGKSLVVDALGLVLGAKADANMVRQGQKQLEVSALFSLDNQPEVKALLASFGYLPESAVTVTPSVPAAPAEPVAPAVPDDSTATELQDTALNAAVHTVVEGQGSQETQSVSEHPSSVTAANGSNLQYAVVADGQAVSVEAASSLQRERELAAHAAHAAHMGHVSSSCSEVQTVSRAGGAGAGDVDDADAEESNTLILRRVVTAEGKSKAYINGHMATLAQLRELSEGLVAIHGQHASVQLMDEKHQLEIVDNFGKLRPLVAAVNDAFNQYTKLRTELTRLSEEQKQGAAVYKQDRYELDELKRLDLHEGDYEELEAKFDRAMHQAQFSYALANFRNMVEGGDSNVISILREHLVELDKVKAYDPNLEKIMDNIEAAVLHLEDGSALATDLVAQDLEMSTTELEGRMSKVHDLARRFACSPKDLYLMTERLERKVNDFWSLRDRITEVTEEVKAARSRYEDLAEQLSAQRSSVAQDFARSINDKITALALPDARFDVAFTREGDGKPRLNGRDRLCFMFSANLGQDLKPLSAVASGGELSRLALTIEVLTASVKSTPTLIFDEVDTGISGRTASAVGALLKELGRYVQVITVTHLPQVAAKANTQFVVAKSNVNGQVNSTISALDNDGRIEEISRMIGGSVITETTRKSAYELLHDL